MQKITNLLQSKKLKVTPQRLAIFNVLNNTKSHPSAETIYNSLQETNPTMSLATVYKTLDCFKTHNLIQELNVGEDSFRYDANVESHPHLICNICQQVSDMDPSISKNIRNEIKDKTDFILESEQLYFYGICPECQ